MKKFDFVRTVNDESMMEILNIKVLDQSIVVFDIHNPV